MKTRLLSIVAMLFLSALVLGACSSTSAEEVTGTARDEITAFANPKTENMIAGMTTRDYVVFSQDMTDDMKKGIDEKAFINMIDGFDEKLGTYTSYSVTTVLQQDKYSTVVYELVYEKAPAVTMRVVFDKDEPHAITGLWFDSPELRAK